VPDGVYPARLAAAAAAGIPLLQLGSRASSDARPIPPLDLV